MSQPETKKRRIDNDLETISPEPEERLEIKQLNEGPTINKTETIRPSNTYSFPPPPSNHFNIVPPGFPPGYLSSLPTGFHPYFQLDYSMQPNQDLNKSKSKSNTNSELKDKRNLELEEDNKYLRKENHSYRQEIKDLKKEISSLKKGNHKEKFNEKEIKNGDRVLIFTQNIKSYKQPNVYNAKLSIFKNPPKVCRVDFEACRGLKFIDAFDKGLWCTKWLNNTINNISDYHWIRILSIEKIDY